MEIITAFYFVKKWRQLKIHTFYVVVNVEINYFARNVRITSIYLFEGTGRNKKKNAYFLPMQKLTVRKCNLTLNVNYISINNYFNKFIRLALGYFLDKYSANTIRYVQYNIIR